MTVTVDSWMRKTKRFIHSNCDAILTLMSGLIGWDHDGLMEKSPTVKYHFLTKMLNGDITQVGELIDYLKLKWIPGMDIP